MADMPGRPASEPDDRAGGSGNGGEADGGGWGSPVPAEYGSLRAVRSPDQTPGGAEGRPERTDGPPAAERWGVSSLRRLWSASGPTGSTADGAADGPGREVPAPTLTSLADRTAGRETGAHPLRDRQPADRQPADRRFADRDGRDQLTDFERMDGAGPVPSGRDGAGPGADGSSRPHTDGLGPSVTVAGGSAPGRADLAPTDGDRAAESYRATDPEPQAYGSSADPDPLPHDSGSDSLVGADLPTEAVPAVGSGAAAGAGAAMGAGSVAGLRPGVGGPSAGGPFGPPGARRRPGRRRSRATVRHIDVLTVLRVSLIFYLVVLVVFVVASLFLWLAADTFGSLPSIEKSVRTLFSLKSFTLHPGAVALYTGASGLVLAVAGTLWNVLLAFMYNLIADVVGGVRVELESFTKE